MKATNTSSWNVRLLLAVALVSASVATARAIDPAKSPSCESGCCESLASPLSKLPYLNRLFKNVGIGYDEGVERIGIDFDFIVATDGKCGDKCSAACVTTCTAKCDTAKCDTAKCDHACDKTCGEACVAKCEAKCEAKCGDAKCGEVCANKCGEVCASKCGETCGKPCADQCASKCEGCPLGAAGCVLTEDVIFFPASPEFIVTEKPKSKQKRADRKKAGRRAGPTRREMELAIKNARLEATLEATESAFEMYGEFFEAKQESTESLAEMQIQVLGERMEMLEELAELKAENATRAAQLEMLEGIVELQSENATLAAQLELLEKHAALASEMAKLQARNEQLTQQLEAIQRQPSSNVQLSTHSEPVLKPERIELKAKPPAVGKPVGKPASKIETRY